MTEQALSVGYVGLGAMGGAMAANLLRAGHRVIVFDANAARVEELQGLGASSAESAAGVAERADVMFTSLPGTREVLAVYLGAGGVIDGAHKGLTAVDMSTVTPRVAVEVAQGLEQAGCEFLDAPVARTKEAAVAGTLSIMVGGSESGYARILPLLEVMGSTVVRVGELGSGQVAKLLNNAVLMSNIVTACEALLVGTRFGVDAGTLVDVLSEGSADSFALRHHIAQSVVPGEFAENRFPLDYALKDLDYFFELCRDTGSVCMQLSTARELYYAARNQGRSREYFPVVAEVVELLGGGRISAAGSRHDKVGD
jgi:3-hydroxyisobutyrate dehydrogenase-like beta-hydroxyacid dehydrogenase